MPDRVGAGRLHRQRDAWVALEVAQLAPRAERGEHHLVAVEPDPHAAHLRRAVGVHRDDVGEVRTFEDLAGGVGEGDHPGRVERRRCSVPPARLMLDARSSAREVVGEAQPGDGSRRGGLAHGGLDRSLARRAPRRSCARRAPRRCAASCTRHARTGSPWSPGRQHRARRRRHASARRGRRRPAAASTSSSAVDVGRRPGHRRRRGHAQPGCSATPRRVGLALAGGPRRAGHRDHRRDGRDQRRRHARAALRLDAGAGARRGGRARHGRRGARQPRRACSRTTPATTCAGLLCGSEGTLGIVTRARLRLVPVPARAGRGAPRLRVDRRRRRRAARPARPARRCTPWRSCSPAGSTIVGRPPRRRRSPCARARRACCSSSWPATTRCPSSARSCSALDLPDDADRGGRRRPVASGGCGAGARRTRRPPPPTASSTRPTSPCRSPAMADFVDEVVPAVERVAPGALTLVYGHLADGNLHVNIVGPGRRRRPARATRCSSSCSRLGGQRERRARHRRGQAGLAGAPARRGGGRGHGAR